MKSMLTAFAAHRFIGEVIVLAADRWIAIGAATSPLGAHGECLAQFGGRLVECLHAPSIVGMDRRVK